MKPLHTRMLEARKRTGIPWEILERDYLLSWILSGISQVDSLSNTLVFKGGTGNVGFVPDRIYCILTIGSRNTLWNGRTRCG
jgi:hypothetical protein